MRTVDLRRTLLPLVAAALWACGGDSTTEVVPVASVDVNQNSISLVVGQTATISATPKDASGNALTGRSVTFNSNNAGIASVTSAGVVRGESEGTTFITVASEGASTQVNVSVAPAPVATVEVSPSPLELIVGGMGSLTVILKDAQGGVLTGRAVTFNSQNESVVTVDQSGVVTAEGIGSTTVTATSEGQQGQATVNVSPVPVATVEVDPAELDLVVGEQQALAVTLKDAEGNVLDDRDVAFESNDEAVVTVDEDGLVIAVAIGSTTVTVSSEGVETDVPVDVTAPPFEPTADTQIDGNREWASITIPAGVTVTVTANSVIHSLGEVNVAGAVMADCHEINLVADGPVTVTGTVDNRCTSVPDADGEQLRIVGTGAMTFTGSTVTSSGDLELSNDSTITLAEFGAAQAFGIPVRALGAAMSGPCSYSGMYSPDRPKPPTPSTSGKSGANGTNAKTKRFLCDGDFDFDGTDIEGNDAGDGENGEAAESDESQGPAEGGDGGDAGQARVLARGNITFRNGATIRLGNGGDGGDATRIAPPNRAAEATGGKGGKSGTLIVRAGGGISIPQNGGLTIDIGQPGDGGDATAVGGKGDDSTAGEDAKPGGNATATGGDGGDTPDADFKASGNVDYLNIILSGGPAGKGGKANATGGQGGHGVTKEHPDGAKGGDQTPTGGKGGEAPAGDFDAMPFVNAGMGGDAQSAGGIGGNGFDGCSVTPHVPGGDGGDGGTGTTKGGDGGSIGKETGAGGEAIVQTNTGDGGNGNDGVGPGTGGSGGGESNTDGIKPAPGAVDDMNPNYEDGSDGKLCIMVAGGPLVGEHQVGVSPCPTFIGTITITNPYDQPITVNVVSLGTAIDTDPSGSVGIAAGGSVDVDVYFNCFIAASFSTVIRITGTTSDGFGIIPVDVPVTMIVTS